MMKSVFIELTCISGSGLKEYLNIEDISRIEPYAYSAQEYERKTVKSFFGKKEINEFIGTRLVRMGSKVYMKNTQQNITQVWQTPEEIYSLINLIKGAE